MTEPPGFGAARRGRADGATPTEERGGARQREPRPRPMRVRAHDAVDESAAELMRPDPPGVAHPKVTGRYPNRTVAETGARDPGAPRHRTWPSARHADVCDPPRRARVAHDRVGWSRRAARQHVGHARRGALPDRDVDVARRRASGSGCSNASARCARATASDSRSQARNREVALERLRVAAGGRAAGRPAPAGDEADAVGEAGPPRRQAPPVARASRTAAAPTDDDDSTARDATPATDATLRSCTPMHVLHAWSCGSRSGSASSSWCSTRRIRTFVLPAGADADRHPRRVHRAAVGVQPHRPRARAPTTAATR